MSKDNFSAIHLIFFSLYSFDLGQSQRLIFSQLPPKFTGRPLYLHQITGQLVDLYKWIVNKSDLKIQL